MIHNTLQDDCMENSLNANNIIQKFQPVRVMDNYLLVKEKEIAQREGGSREEKERKNVQQLYLVKRCPPPAPLSVSQASQFLVSSDVCKKSTRIKKRKQVNFQVQVTYVSREENSLGRLVVV